MTTNCNFCVCQTMTKKYTITPLCCCINNIQTNRTTYITPLGCWKIQNDESKNKEFIYGIFPFLCYVKMENKEIFSCSLCHFNLYQKDKNCTVCCLFCNCNNCFCDPFLIDSLFIDDLPLKLTFEERENLCSLCICKFSKKNYLEGKTNNIKINEYIKKNNLRYKKNFYTITPISFSKKYGPEIQKMTDIDIINHQKL